MRLGLARGPATRALLVACGAVAALALSAGPAAADVAVTLNPAHVGATAAGFGVHDDDCGNGPNEDGWHFIAPGNKNFTSLHLEFDVGGSTLVIDLGAGDFGPPDDSHAFVSTPVGAILTAGSGTTDSATPQGTFNLSHTCPGTPPTTQPPTSEPPTSEPPTSEPPTSEPPTTEPPTTEPPTSAPPTSAPPTTAPPAVSDGELPATGGGSLVPILFGLGLVLLCGGGTAVIAARARSSSG